MKRLFLIILIIHNFSSIHSQSVPSGWAELTEENEYILSILYATDSNFVGETLYECGACFLREEVAKALNKVRAELKEKGYTIKLWDCYRPKPVQQALWDKVPDASYVTPPWKGSMHNRGMAVDLTLVDCEGHELDMGTPYDFFGPEAHTDNENLPLHVKKNRKILKDVLNKHGFRGIRTEWWHFSFKGTLYPIAEWGWKCD